MRRLSNAQCTVSQTLRANDPFQRFKPESHQAVRRPDVTGQSYAEQARRTREMLRSLTPEKARDIIEFRGDLNLFQASAVAKREGKMLVPNDVHDRILMETKDKGLLVQFYGNWLWTGTLVIYVAPGKKFGKNIVFSWEDNVKYSISFQIPKQFRGKTNCALVIEHPDFELIDLKDNKYELKLLEGANVRLLENFPTKSQRWYNTDSETKIPIGRPVKESKDARCLWRFEDSSYLGPVARYFDYGGDNRRQFVYAVCRSTLRFGVAFVQLASSEV